MPDPLRLRARDQEDFGVIAALLQDALVPVSELAYLPAEQRFVLLLNRFRWETAFPDVTSDEEVGDAAEPVEDVPFEEGRAERKPHFERIHCGLCFDHVRAVRTKGIDLRARDRILELLTIRVEEGAVLLIFAGDAAIRLEVESLRCCLEDLGEGWPTRWRPKHRLEGDE